MESEKKFDFFVLEDESVKDEKIDGFVAECGVIGAMLSDFATIPIVMEELGSDALQMFEGIETRFLFEQILLEIEAIGRPSPMTMLVRAEKHEARDRIEAILLKIAKMRYSPDDVKNFLYVMRERYIRGEISRVARKLQQASSAQSESIASILDEVAKSMESLAALKRKNAKFKPESHKQIIQSVVKNYQKKHGRDDIIDGLWTGWTTESGTKICVPTENDLTIIAARPGRGKSDLAKEIAINFSMQGINGLFFSLEMSRNQVGERIISSKAALNRTKMRFGKLEGDSLDRMIEMRDEAQGEHIGHIYIDDTPGIEFSELEAKTRLYFLEKNIKYIVVDYIQLGRYSGFEKDKRIEVGRYAGGLKRLAGELGIAVIALAQLNRLAEKEKISMAHLKEAGDLEQDATMIWLIESSETYNPDEFDLLLINQAKHRHLGESKFTFYYKRRTGEIVSQKPNSVGQNKPTVLAANTDIGLQSPEPF